MALRSEKARFGKNVRQEHEADYISLLSSSLRSRSLLCEAALRCAG